MKQDEIILSGGMLMMIKNYLKFKNVIQKKNNCWVQYNTNTNSFF